MFLRNNKLETKGCKSLAKKKVPQGLGENEKLIKLFQLFFTNFPFLF